MKRTLLALPLLALSACGYTDAGGGTQTLYVVANARFTVSQGQTHVTVEVHRAGAAVDDASVYIRDGESGDLATAPRTSIATYGLDLGGYRRRLGLEIQATSGGSSDSLRAKLEGPSPHVIVNPKAGGLTRGSQGSTLEIEWACSDGLGADQVEIGVSGGFSKVVTSDSGKTDGPAMSALSSGTHTLNVTRVTSTDLAGGVAGSVFNLAFDVESEFDIID